MKPPKRLNLVWDHLTRVRKRVKNLKYVLKNHGKSKSNVRSLKQSLNDMSDHDQKSLKQYITSS